MNKIGKWAALALMGAALACGVFALKGFMAESAAGSSYKELQEEARKTQPQEESTQEAKKQEPEEKTEEPEPVECPVDFARITEECPDCYAWIRIPDTNIDYPIVQSPTDNSFYLDHNPYGDYEYAGAIFTENLNARDFNDPNTVIYGHNMKNGSMFGQLRLFTKQETLDKNPYFWMFTPNFIFQYRIISCAVVGITGDPYTTRFTEEDFQKFIDDTLSRSEIDCGDVTVTTSDRLMTLSTCTGDSSTRRILQGVLEQVYIAK